MGRLKLLGATLWVLGAMALAGTLYLGVQLSADLRLFPIEQIEVRGNVFADAQTLIDASGLSPGEPLFARKVRDLTRRVERVNWVRSARITRRLPAQVVIEVEEFEPRYLVQLDRLYYMSADGFVVDAPLEAGLDYPVVTGVSWARLEAPGPDREALLALLEQLDAHDLTATIDEVHFDTREGFTLYGDLPRPAGVHLGWGAVEEKFMRLARVRAMLNRRGQYATSLDLTYDDRIVARLEPLAQRGSKR